MGVRSQTMSRSCVRCQSHRRRAGDSGECCLVPSPWSLPGAYSSAPDGPLPRLKQKACLQWQAAFCLRLHSPFSQAWESCFNVGVAAVASNVPAQRICRFLLGLFVFVFLVPAWRIYILTKEMALEAMQRD